MIQVNDKSKSAAKITSSMTWWLRKGRVFKLDHYEISVVHIYQDKNSVKILIKNTLTNEEEIVEENSDLDQ